MTDFRSTWYEQRNWGITYPLQALSLSNDPSDLQLLSKINEELSEIMSPEPPNINNTQQWLPADVTQIYKNMAHSGQLTLLCAFLRLYATTFPFSPSSSSRRKTSLAVLPQGARVFLASV